MVTNESLLSFVGWVKPTKSHGDGGFHPPYNCLTNLLERTYVPGSGGSGTVARRLRLRR